MANIATTNITSGNSNTPATSFNTASVTPTANRICLLAVGASGGALPNTPTVTGASATWTKIADVGINGFVRLTIFATFNAAPGTGALTIDFGGQSQDRCAWVLDNFTNTRITGVNGANAIVQAITNSAASDTTVIATLATFSNTANATYGACLTQNATLRNIAAGTGFTETIETDTADFMALSTEFRNDNDTSVDFTASGSSSHLGVVGIELANLSTEVTPGTGAVNFLMGLQ